MRTLEAAQITAAVAKLAVEANYNLSPDIYDALVAGREKEESPLGKEILGQLVTNACIAREEAMPICQDTGMAVVFVELGQDVHITGGSLADAVNAGVAKGYTEGYLRKSVVDDPLFDRKNTQDNTPAILHVELVPGDKLKITLAPKGFGSENMSALKMFKPAEGVVGVKSLLSTPFLTPALIFRARPHCRRGRHRRYHGKSGAASEKSAAQAHKSA
ncbi:Fe-S type hydro-lyases tartrate/fumarate alpha region [Thermosinus carboxydivorans Nor1]|uniref:Fe-S type hydro-lyases tartrate/fumarate alpha region n=1 Tax=Thermosinus carboxydivorans Nor1 TaxID=401526 RepID=A1HQH2_9FIRM|nr:Fe-S type hydro-lyases tartrate/fumarate alpha region [Thermosinus carboxydivorans Nor1]